MFVGSDSSYENLVPTTRQPCQHAVTVRTYFFWSHNGSQMMREIFISVLGSYNKQDITVI